MLKEIITAYIRSKLEHVSTIWSLQMRRHVDRLEKIQNGATKIIPNMSELQEGKNSRRPGHSPGEEEEGESHYDFNDS